MESITSLLTLIVTMSIFYMCMDFRYDKKIVAIVFSIFGIVSFTIYSILVQNGFDPETISIICFSLPSLILCFVISKYRGSRFIFTFASIDLLGMTALILGRIIGGFFEYNQLVIFVSSFLLLLLYFGIAVLFRKNYLKILRSVKTGWLYMATAVIVMYALTLMLIGYPVPLRERREYSPVIIVFILFVFVFFKVIYESANNNLKKVNDEQGHHAGDELIKEYARGECLGESKDIRDLLKKADSNMYKDKRMQKQEK